MPPPGCMSTIDRPTRLGTPQHATMSGMRQLPSERLIIAVTNLRNVEAALDAARKERDHAIVADLEAGVLQVDIVKATGINREQVRRITDRIRKATP